MYSETKAYYLTHEYYDNKYTHIILVPENVAVSENEIFDSYTEYLKENSTRNTWTEFFRHLTYKYEGIVYINTQSSYVDFEGLAQNSIELFEDTFKRIALEKALADAEEQVLILKEKLAK